MRRIIALATDVVERQRGEVFYEVENVGQVIDYITEDAAPETALGVMETPGKWEKAPAFELPHHFAGWEPTE